VFKRPRRFLAELPIGVAVDRRQSFLEVGFVVSSKIQGGSGRSAPREDFEKGGLDQTVLPMAALGPGIGEEDKDLRKRHAVRQYGHKITGIRMQKGEIGQTGPVTLAQPPANPVAHDVDAHAEAVGMGRRIRREKVAVPGANFEGELAVAPHLRFQFGQQLGTAGCLQDLVVVDDDGFDHGRDGTKRKTSTCEAVGSTQNRPTTLPHGHRAARRNPPSLRIPQPRKRFTKSPTPSMAK